MGEYGLGHLVADPHDGIEGGHGLLEDHGHAAAAQGLQHLLRHLLRPSGAGSGEVASWMNLTGGGVRNILDPTQVVALVLSSTDIGVTTEADGLTELRNSSKEMLGQERLGEGFSRICAARPGEGSADIAEALRRMLDEFAGDQFPEDDRAFLLAQRR